MFEEILLESFIAVGTIAFAMSGSFKAIRHELDVFGVLVLGFSTALGGGLIRDALVHKTPSAFIDMTPAIYALIGCAIVLFSRWFSRQQVHNLANPEGKAFLYLDALGLAAFTVLGARVGSDAGLNAFGIIMLAAITGVGGGMIRDILAGEVPLVLKADFYATATIIGGLIFYILQWLSIDVMTASMITFIATLILRLLAIQYRWQLPKPKL